MRLTISVDLEVQPVINDDPDIIAQIHYPDEGDKIAFCKGLSKIEFELALLHELGHLFDWYVSEGELSENADIREANAEALEKLQILI